MKITRKRLRRIISEELRLALFKEADSPIAFHSPKSATTAATLQEIKANLASGNMDEAQTFAAFPLLVFGNSSQLIKAGVLTVTSSTVSPIASLARKLKAKEVPLASNWSEVYGIADTSGPLGAGRAASLNIEESWPNALQFAIELDTSPTAKQLTITRLEADEIEADEIDVDETYQTEDDTGGKVQIAEDTIHSAVVDAVLETAGPLGIELDKQSVASTLGIGILNESNPDGQTEDKNRYTVTVYNK